MPASAPAFQIAPRTVVESPQADRLAAEFIRQAAEAVDAIEGEDAPYYRGHLLPEIAAAQVKCRDFDGAMRTALAMPQKDMENTLIAVALSQSQAGDEKGLAATMAALGDEGRRRTRGEPVRNLAIAQARAGEFSKAQATAETIIQSTDRVGATLAIAVEMARAGEKDRGAALYAQAVQVIDDSKDGIDKLDAHLSVYRARLQANDPRADESLERLNKEITAANDSWSRFITPLHLAETFWRAGRRGDAERAYDQARLAATKVNDLNRLNAPQIVAKSLVRVGDLPAAIKAIEQIPIDPDAWTDLGYREEVWYDVSMAQLRTGDLAGAMKSARQIQRFTQCRGEAAVKIVPALARQGKIKDALDLAQECDSPSRIARAILEVAIVQALAGDKAAARKTAAETSSLKPKGRRLAAAISGEDPTFNYQDPETWTELYDYTGPVSRSWSEVEKTRAGELAAAAMRLHVALGDLDSSACALAFNKLSDFYGPVIRAIAQAQSAANDAPGAKLWIDQLTNPIMRASALLGAAEGLPRAPSLDEHGAGDPAD